MKRHSVILMFLGLMLLSCSSKEPLTPETVEEEGQVYLNRCDFDNVTLGWYADGSCSFSQVTPPSAKGEGHSLKCGMVQTGGGQWEYIFSDPLPRKLDFTANEPIFKMSVLSPRKGARIILRLSGSGATAIDADVHTGAEGAWETVYFDFRDQEPESNVYNALTLFFDAGGTSVGDKWYFDNLFCPSDDLTAICLFKRYDHNPVFKPDGSSSWRGSHMANAAIMTPDQTSDRTWRVYLRGSGFCPEYCDQIGLYTQPEAGFKPFGPWVEYPFNPVLAVGPAGSFDGGYLLDTAPVAGPDGTVYVYYNGQSAGHSSHGLCVRYSTDGGFTFKGIDAPLIVGKGCSDAVYHDGKFYIYYGGGNPCRLYVTVSDDPLSFEKAESFETIPIGGGPSNFDSFAVNGSMVFRLKGVDKWFASYQGSSNVYDFPDRFHIATSDDLIHWTKVDNDQPLFTRGSAGQWDQGAIWFCEIFEYEDMLYLYYEGWGRPGYVTNRDKAYFSGNSCVGAASCSKADFLKWCGLK